MQLTAEQEAIRERALAFARQHKKSIAKAFTDRSKFLSEELPVSVFMAGSPGAGKTEASIELLDRFSNDGAQILRIDPDDLRTYFEEYSGGNSYSA